jgi:hypothetical protein
MGLLGAPRTQVFPLSYPRCCEPVRIIAFVTEVESIPLSLNLSVDPSNPRRLPLHEVHPSGRRTPIQREVADVAVIEPLPAYEFDQPLIR